VILLIAFVETKVGTPDFGSSCSRTSFEPHPGETPAGQQLVRKPDGNADGRHIESQPTRNLRRYGATQRLTDTIRHIWSDAGGRGWFTNAAVRARKGGTGEQP
jgi:hypothetical protein